MLAEQRAVRAEEQHRAIAGAAARARSRRSRGSIALRPRPRRCARSAGRAPRWPPRDRAGTPRGRRDRARRRRGRSSGPSGSRRRTPRGTATSFAPVAAASADQPHDLVDAGVGVERHRAGLHDGDADRRIAHGSILVGTADSRGIGTFRTARAPAPRRAAAACTRASGARRPRRSGLPRPPCPRA